MLKKKILNIMSVFMIITLFSGCADIKSTQRKQSVTLVINTPSLAMNSVSNPDIECSADFLDIAGKSFAEQYEDADVKLDIKMFDYRDEVEAVTGSFGTQYAPDILYEAYFNMAGYIHTGRVVPLDDIISEDIRSDIDESAWNMSQVNGKTYMMPYLNMQNVLIYNKSLMRDCGLDKYISDTGDIQNWTIDEWEDILDTLAQRLPKRVYPMMMYGKNNQGDTHIMSYIRAFGSTIFDADGNFNFKSPEAVKALAWIQGGVARGWYPPHTENLEITDLQELFNNNQLVFYLFNNANLVLYDSIEDYGFVNFPGNITTSFATGFEVFDNGDDLKIKVAKDFIKYIYETEELMELSAGNIPESKRIAEKYGDKIFMLDKFESNEVNVVDFMNNTPNWQGTDTSVRSVFYTHIHDLLLGIVSPDECGEELDADCNNALKIGREESRLHE